MATRTLTHAASLGALIAFMALTPILPAPAADSPPKAGATISLNIDGLPTGFTSAVKPDKDTYQVTITGPKDAASGRHMLRVVAYGEFKGSGQILPLELPFEIGN